MVSDKEDVAAFKDFTLEGTSTTTTTPTEEKKEEKAEEKKEAAPAQETTASSSEAARAPSPSGDTGGRIFASPLVRLLDHILELSLYSTGTKDGAFTRR